MTRLAAVTSSTMYEVKSVVAESEETSSAFRLPWLLVQSGAKVHLAAGNVLKN